MNQRTATAHSKKFPLNSVSKSILRAFAPLLFGASMSAGAQTVLNPGQDIYTNGLNTGQYNLQLSGNATWNTVFNSSTAATGNISIEGAGNTITYSGGSAQRLLFLRQNNSNIAITNSTITSAAPFTGAQNGLIKMDVSNVTSNLNLEGTTFKDIGPTNFTSAGVADYGPLINIRGGTSNTLNISGGTAGVLFQGNHGLYDQPGAIGIYGNGNTMNFTGKVTFDSNYTGNYGGAVTVYDIGFQTMSFAGDTTFTNNHSAVFGGAIDFWGGSANMTFNGPATFSGNYVYGATSNTASSPSHVLDQHSRGGAINIGYLDPGANGVTLAFNGPTTFDGNYVVDAKNGYNALGGAVSAYGNGGNRNYFMNFNGATTFSNNYVYSLGTGNVAGYGGAIYYDAGTNATLNLGPGSQVINNSAQTLGGGIYLQTGTINLNATGGNITFQGNRQGVSFAQNGDGVYVPTAGTGVPNAIYLGGTGSLNFVANTGNTIDFYDPIASASGITVTVNKTGAGNVVFHGNSGNPGDPTYNSDIRTNTNVTAGTFALTDAVIYGNSSFGTFAVNNTGTVQGGDASTLRAQNINITSGGQVRVAGGIFNLDAGNAISVNTGVFIGSGILSAPSIALLGGLNGSADAGQTLTVDAVLTNTGTLVKLGSGTLVLAKANTYSGSTTVFVGTLQAGIANTIANSSGLTINNGTFDLNNFSQNLKGLSGGANASILMGTNAATTLTVNSAANSTYSGTITGVGSVFKQGTGQLTLRGNVNLSGAGTSDIQTTAGSLLINGGNTVEDLRTRIYGGSTVTVSNGSTLTSRQATYVGDASGGTLNVDSGGQVTGGDLDIGQSVASATATITGSGSAVNVTGAINAGWTGSGTLQINSGATATSGSGAVGALAGGNGTATVDGVGSAWTMAGSGGLVVGNAGSGTMTIQNGGAVTTTTGGVRLGNGANSGTLNVNASSVLATNSLSKGTGTGQFNLNGGTLRALSDNASFISGFSAGNLALLAGGGTIDSNGFNIGTANIFSGAGKLTKAGAGTLTLSGVNSYTGGTDVTAGTLRLTDAGAVTGAVNVASGATMFIDVPTGGSYTFSNALTGSGLLQAGLLSTTDTFAFGAGVGSLFTGTVRLGNSTFALSGNNIAPLTNATLQLDSGNTTVVGSGTQTIGNLTLNGGALQFANLSSGGVINTGTLSLNSGTVAVDPGGIVNAADNILLQDSGIDYRLITASSVTGSSANLTLTDLAGNPVTDTADIVQVSNVVAIGTYGFTLGDDATGLYTRYQLTQLALQAGQTTSLSGDTPTPAGANELTAKVTGSGNLSINATTSITLNNSANDYTGSTNVHSGSLILGSDNALGQTSALNIFSGASVDMNGKTQTVGALSDAGSLLMNGGALTVANGGTLLGVISGTSGSFTLAGGTQALGGANTFTGTTTINNGATLQVGLGATAGSYAGDIVDNGLVNFARSDTLHYDGVISGSGAVGLIGSGTIVFTDANTYTGGTTISDGTLQIGNNNFTGSIVGDVVNNGALVFRRTNFYTFAGAISGNGTVTQASGGTLVLSGNSTYTGATSVNAGTLLVNGSLGNTAVTVASGATLGGIGVIGGPVTVANGGHLSPGESPGTLTTGTLTLNTGSFLDFELNTPNVVGGATNDLLAVNGDLTLNGILNVSNAGNTALAAGKYRLIDYTGSLLNPGGTLTFGTLPGGTLGRDLFVQTSITGQVNLISSFGLTLNVWDGGNTALHDNSVVNGGDGVWDNANRNWTTDSGDINGLWNNNAIAQFGGMAGTVTVSTATGPVNLSGAQFTASGYNITGGPLTTNTASTGIAVGDGMTATISSVITGSGGINKTDPGTLVLSGLNTYTGGTTISAGTLEVQDNGTLNSSVPGNIVNNGILKFVRGSTPTTVNVTGVISGSGSLIKEGPAGSRLHLLGANTFTGGITVNGGVFQVGGGGTTGSIVSDVTVNSGTALSFNRSDTYGYAGTITGAGSLNIGGGTLILTGNANQTGGTNIVGAPPATLQVGNGGTTGSITGNVTGIGALVFNRSDTYTWAGARTAGTTGSLTQAGTGTLILTGNSAHSGGTTISAGIMQLGDGGTTGSVTGNITDNGALVFNRSDTALTMSGVISGSGTLTQAGTGRTTLTGVNTYAGGTTVSAGTLRLTGAGTIGSGAATIASGGLLLIDMPSGGNYAFNNALTGSGVLQAGLTNAANTFDFGAGVGSVFTGTVKLGTSSFVLSGVNTTALTNATLQLDAGNTTTVGSGPQNIGNLTFNGGATVFSNLPGGIINTGILTLNSGSVRVDPANATVTGNLLTQDDGVGQQLISAASVVGSAGNLILTDLSGNALTTSNANIVQGGNTVAIGTYDYSLSTSGSAGSGLYAQYSLTQLALQAGQTTTLSGDATTPAGANELHAKLTGSGDLLVSASNSITLNNSANDYTGQTTVSSGTLIVGSDNALGATNNLQLLGSSTVDLNGKTQAIGGLSSGSTSSVFNVNGGNLTLNLANSTSVFNGALTGSSGSITIDKASGGLTLLDGASTYTGLMTINSGSDLLLSSSASYVGDITNNGRLAFANNPDLTYNGVVSGTGSLLKFGSNTRLTLGGVNSYSGGTTISNGTISMTNASALGSGVINNDSALELAFTADGTLSNQLTGTGSLTKVGSSIATLSGVGSTQGAVTVNAGTLNFAQSGVFNAASLSTASGATTGIVANSTLNLSGALTQNSGSTLSVALGSAQPIINASNASLDGTLNISGFSATVPNSASALASTQFTIIHTTGGISGDFASVSLGGATSPADYLTLSGSKSANNNDYNVGFGLTWLAGPAQGNGIFTLADGNTFNVDVALTDQTGPFSSGWDGKTLTKAGAGTLILSAANTYTGDTLINAGTLQAGIANAFINSANVTVADGATLDLNNFAQQATNLSGAGNVTLGSGALTVNSLTNTAFSGVISGTGSLSKIGSGTFTLSNANTYGGGTSINGGTLLATNAGALGSGVVANNAALQLDFAGTLANQLTGSGTLTKQGSGTVTLTAAGSTQGAVTVSSGELAFAQSGAFTTASLSSASGATTSIAADSTLNISGALTQNSGSTLSVALGSAQPVINAATANLDGTLNISGFSASAPNSASALASTLFNIIHTTGGISGDFSNVNLSGAVSLVDYLILSGSKSADGNDYNVGFGLTWLAGPAQGNGIFTLASGNTFNVDVALADQTGLFSSGWDGKTLTKAGAGTLILSAANTYTGDTLINAGTLQTGIANAFINSANVTVAGGATLNLNNFAQQATNLSGAGNVTLGSGALTVNSLTNTAFGGVISGTGSLSKIGSGTLTLSNANAYSGGSTITDGILLATNAGALGSGVVTNSAALQLNFTGALANQLAGTGSLTKQGSGTVTLTAAGSTQGAVSVTAGTLNFAQSGVFNAASLSTISGATTSIAANSTLNLSGALTQSSGSTLTVGIGSTQPVITAATAALDGTLNISGFSATAPNTASALTTTEFTIIRTTGGITGDFASVNLGGATSPVDYLTLAGRKSVDGNDYNVGFGLTWLAGPAQGNGIFTLASGNTFNVDVALADQTGPFTSNWDGKTLTKAGAGTLILSAANTYTGDTLINAGTLQTGIANAFINSANVTVAGGATLNLNNFAQQATNLSGAGNVMLGSGALTVNSLTNTAFSGVISGTGSLSKIGSGTLTLSNANTYSGGSSINDGIVLATNAGALGSGAVANDAALQLDFTGTLANQLTGSGALIKQGSGTVTLTGAGSTQGGVTVNAGTLNFAQSGAFSAGSLGTASGATTSIAANSTLALSGTLAQNSGSTLSIALGSIQPIITAANANLDGTLNISGFSATAPNSASALASTLFTIIHTTGGISGDFSSVNLGGATNTLDYLTLAAAKSADGNDYNVGFGLTWLASPAQGNGIFTLASGNTFNVDVALADQTGPFTSGWDGKTLTKAGTGTLILSAANTYTGDTLINAGTLQTGIADAFINSANVTVAGGAVLDLNGFNQQATNLSGAGNVTLGSGALTVNSLTNTAFSGVISGTGSLSKIGSGTLTLSNANAYSGGSIITDGILLATNAGALGSGAVTNNTALQLDFSGTLTNQLAGTGSLTKQGSGTVTLTGAGSTQGAVSINSGTLNFAQSGAFNAASLTTASGATTALATDSTVVLSGVLTQNSGSILSVAIGSTTPIISAASASLDGELKITGINTSLAPTKASELPNTQLTVIQTTGGISGDFASVDLGGASSSVDYITIGAGKSADGNNYNVGYGLTWLVGPDQGNGIFTLSSGSTFNVDVVLADQTGPFTSGWDGKTLTKAGPGMLILSAANTYTGDTLINGGTLQTGIADAMINSANVTVANGATLDLGGFNQQVNNLSGTGSITLGNADLTVNSLADTSFGGSISGNGQLIKSGSGTFTVSGTNFYGGGTTINAGRLVGTQASALGVGGIQNNAELELAFAADQTLSNQLSGTGTLLKTGAGTAILNASGSSQGNVAVNGGKLQLAENGVFNSTGNYTTASGATTSVLADATLNVGGQFATDGTLEIVAGNINPVVTAGTAVIGSGSTFNLSGYSAPASTSASQLAYGLFTVIQTAAPGNLTGSFAEIDLGGSSSPVDYLTMTAIQDTQSYKVGLALTWYAGQTATPQNANGSFTLTGANEYFDLDVVLANEAANAATGWDGMSLTKAGAGTLELSKANTYTGETRINGGMLRAGTIDTIAASSQVSIADGATLDLNGYDQRLNNLNGAGDATLGGAALTANNTADTVFSGVISGVGSLSKTGAASLILAGNNTYNGGTTISAGTLQLGNGGDSGSVMGDIVNNATLVFNRSDAYQYGDVISGSGQVIQQGSGSTLFSQSQTYTGNTSVNAGALIMLNDAQLSGTPLVTVAQNAVLGGYGGVGGDVVNNGLLAVADAVPGFANNPAGNFIVGGNLTNNGEIRMASPLPASTLVVNGNYIGNNGLLTLSTVLGGDDSATDKLIVRGSTSGSTRVVVNNSGGGGAQTSNGIQIIQVAGQSAGQFTLANRVAAGAYEYSLYQGLPDQNDGNWYLRSVGGVPDTPQWRPEIGSYLGNQSLTSVMQMHTLYDREGGQLNQGAGSFWLRIAGGKIDSKAAGGNVDMNSDYTLVHFGSDLAAWRDGAQRLQVGLMGSWGQGDTDSTGNRDANGKRYTAHGKVDGYSAGVYATWFADADTRRGAYVDSWLQYGWYNNDATGQGQRTDSYDSNLLTVSLESGYTFQLSETATQQWRLTPQAQIAYSRYSADRFTDVTGTVVDGQNQDLWTSRLGARLSGQMQVNGNPVQPFAEVNWWHSGQNAAVSLDGQSVSEDTPRDRAELKVGVQAAFGKRWSGWAHVGVQSDFNNYQRLEGMAGVRFVW